PEIYLKLLSLGYSSKFCQRMILKNIFKLSDWKILLGALKRWPILATKGYAHHQRSTAPKANYSKRFCWARSFHI
ncbi:MAG: hypothetical protein ACKO13_02310, partial [Cytophagales bacterium]